MRIHPLGHVLMAAAIVVATLEGQLVIAGVFAAMLVAALVSRGRGSTPDR